jgi:hypothetical protein
MTDANQMWEWLIKVGQVPAGSKPPAAPSPEKEEK